MCHLSSAACRQKSALVQLTKEKENDLFSVWRENFWIEETMHSTSGKEEKLKLLFTKHKANDKSSFNYLVGTNSSFMYSEHDRMRTVFCTGNGVPRSRKVQKFSMNLISIHLYNDIYQAIACTIIAAFSNALFITHDHF